jgi:Plasmid pRiA4b ORF-3-like protein
MREQIRYWSREESGGGDIGESCRFTAGQREIRAVAGGGGRPEGYLYDFGDSWQHTIAVEKIVPLPKHPRGCGFVEAGEWACPPDDAGGCYGYQKFLDQFAKNSKSKEVREFLSWAGEDFDPNQFDRHAANATLLRMAWNQWGGEIARCH